VGEAAAQQPPTPAGPAFDEIAESAAEYRRRTGQPELTDEEAAELAVEETKAVRRARRERLTRADR
jgi:hypothetical protein